MNTFSPIATTRCSCSLRTQIAWWLAKRIGPTLHSFRTWYWLTIDTLAPDGAHTLGHFGEGHSDSGGTGSGLMIPVFRSIIRSRSVTHLKLVNLALRLAQNRAKWKRWVIIELSI